MAVLRLTLENTYWLKGFFNVGVDFQRFVTDRDGPIELYLGDATEPTPGRVSRSANSNATPRVFGNKPLADFFQKHYRPGEVIDVNIISPTAMRLGGK